MRAVEAADSSITVLRCDERTLRREGLAGFLQLSGLRVWSPALDTSQAAEPRGGRADLAIIDTGERPRSHPGVNRSFDDLRSTLPSVPIVVISDREDGSAVIDAMQPGVRTYFPLSLDQKLLLETPVRRCRGQAEIPPVT